MTERNLRNQQAGLFLSLFSYEKDRLWIVERAYENKNREGFIEACTCLYDFFLNFFKFFFLEGRGASDLSTLAASTKR